MNEESSKKNRPKKDKSTRPLSDPTEKIEQTKEQHSARNRNSSEPNHYVWGLSWYEFLTVAALAIGLVVGIITVLVQREETISNQERERARIVLFDRQRDPDSPLSFSWTFKNIGETTALNTSAAWLQGECGYTSFQECIDWCLQPLRETQGKDYGPILSQGERIEEFFATLKTGKARKKQLPIYFCGYFAYTDFFCMWRRQFYAVSYDPATDQLTEYTLSDWDEEAQAQNCSPYRRLYK